MFSARLAVLSGLLMLLGACTTVREVQPSTTATEQYLLSQSAMNAARQIKVDPSRLGKVYIDTSNFEGTKFTVAEVQDAMLRNRVAITEDQKQADTILSIRSGVQSIDNRVVTFGVPSVPIPSPIPSVAVSTPALSVAQRAKSVGMTLIGLVAWNAKTGLLVEDLGEVTGLAYNSIWSGAAGTWVSNDFRHQIAPEHE
jgi:hypothetical protein